MTHEYLDFLELFPGSLIFFQHDTKNFVEKECLTLDVAKESWGMMEQKQGAGFAPMYTVNSFWSEPERVEEAREKLLIERGLDAALPSTPRFKENLKAIQACFLDLDLRKEGSTEDIEERRAAVYRQLEAFKMPPTVIVMTKNGLQALWKVVDGFLPDQGYLDQYRATEEGIIAWSKTLGAYGDAVKDVSRIFRLPGFSHLKDPKNPYPVTHWRMPNAQQYKLDELYDTFFEFIPTKAPIEASEFKPIVFDGKPSFDLKEAMNAHVDIREAVARAFQSVGVSFDVDKDNHRWVINGRLTGNFFSREGKNIACTSSGTEPFSGPPFAVVINILKAYGHDNRSALRFMNETWGKSLQTTRSIEQEKVIEQKIDTRSPRFSIQQDVFVKDVMARRYEHYFTWGMEEVDKQGGLLTLGRMAIIGGQHGAGKSTYITEIAKMNSHKKKSMLIPLEMGADFTLMMLAVNLYNSRRNEFMTFMTYGDVEEGYLFERHEHEQQLFIACVEETYSLQNLYIRNPETFDFQTLKAFIEKYNKEEGINFFVIDHLHQLSIPNGGADGETQFFSQVAKELKDLAQRLNIALLCVVQLTKAANMRGADLDFSSFKGTSEFTSNAHRVVVLKRPTFDEPTEAEIKEQFKISNGGRKPTREEISLKKAMLAGEFFDATKTIRELVFLKTRGRDGGTLSIEMEKGKFKFKNMGSYQITN